MLHFQLYDLIECTFNSVSIKQVTFCALHIRAFIANSNDVENFNVKIIDDDHCGKEENRRTFSMQYYSQVLVINTNGKVNVRTVHI